MRFVAAIALGIFAAGAVLVWRSDWAIAGGNADAIGAILMICAGVALIALIFLSASRSEEAQTEALESEVIGEPDDRLSARRPRR
jgi:hypothetical protein